MFAQMTMDKNPDKTKLSFAEKTEKPVFKGLVLSTIAGTLLGGIITAVLFIQLMPPATLAGAILAGAAVGANAGLLLFGLADVVLAGRLEEDAELVESETDKVLNEESQADEKLGQEDYGQSLRQAS